MTEARPLSILLVEDEVLIRMMVADMVEALGHRVVAEAGTIDQAMELARTATYDFAIIDVNLNGAMSFPIAEAIAARHVWAPHPDPAWDEGAARDIARLRYRMEREIGSRSGRHNVKLGRGGLVDVEFLVQYLQLVHGPERPAIRPRSSITPMRSASPS